MTCHYKHLRLRQLFDSASSSYTYFIWDVTTRDLLVVDPVREQFERDLALIGELKLKPKLILETHLHADHVTAISLFKNHFGSELKCAIGVGAKPSEHDLFLEDQSEQRITETLRFKVLATPGHTNCSSCYLIGPWLLTGDTLLIRGCGRTDFQAGSSTDLWYSVRKKLFVLAPETIVFPGHDYKGRTSSTIAEEIEHNPRLKMSHDLEKFKEIMANLQLAKPALIDVAPAANRELGRA